MDAGHKPTDGVTVATSRRKPVGVWMQLKDRKLLARLMAIQGLSTRQLAKAAGWSGHSYLQRLLKGEVNTLKAEPAVLIAHALQVPTDVLFLTRVSTNDGQPDDENGRKKAS